MFCAVIVAAGQSRRAGFDKLAAPLAGLPVLCHSVRAFAQAGAERIVIVCQQARWDELRPWESAGSVPVQRADGGGRRQDSVLSGLREVGGDEVWVAVHDGARPFVTPEGIRACLSAAQEYGAAACAHPVVDTLKRADAEGCCLPEQVERAGMWGMETPQVCRAGILRQALQAACGNECTDEVTALQQLGLRPKLVQIGMNFKITLPHDLELAQAWYARRGVQS